MINDVERSLGKDYRGDINFLIEEYMPFIIKSISETTGKYVSLENSEELSVRLLAFNEAVEKYEDNRGGFLSFCKLVISSRIKNYLKRENKENNKVSFEELIAQGIEIKEDHTNVGEDKEELLREINILKSEIGEFGFTLDDLVEEAPKHGDTRRNALKLSEKVSKVKELTDHLFEKKRLPIKKISLRFTVTEKVIKRSKKFITTGIIIYYKNFRNLKLWIKK